ncbi:MAG: DUF3180 domain-containing protein [Angustibacter sp.]
MRPTRTGPLVAVAAAVAVLGWVVLNAWSGAGRQLPPVPWATPVVMVALAATVLAAGWPVRRWQRGDRDRHLDPLRAARTVVLAKAAQYCGALLTGWYAAQVLALLPTVDVDARRALAVRAAVSMLTAAVLWVVGWIVERWCRIDLSDGPDVDRRDAPPSNAPA